MGYKTKEELISLDIKEYDDRLGINWLSPYRVVLDFYAKIITLVMHKIDKLEWRVGVFLSLILCDLCQLFIPKNL